jgi:hypothetical protein
MKVSKLKEIVVEYDNTLKVRHMKGKNVMLYAGHELLALPEEHLKPLQQVLTKLIEEEESE